MLEPNILHVKYRAKFFFWTDIFLTSSHLPAYLVAAFIKRASRIALTASADALIILLPFIANLLIRHQSLLDALVNKTEASDLSHDPFDNKEPDPSKCNAIDSSLWEIKSLQSHWHPRVVAAASFIDKQLPTIEFDLADVLDTNFDELLEEEIVKEVKLKEAIPIDTTLVKVLLDKNWLNAVYSN